MTTDADFDHLTIVISRQDVEGRKLASTLEILTTLVRSRESLNEHFERIEIAFHGYDSDNRELFEIQEVREFVAGLNNKFPFWPFFLSKYGCGLQCVLLCLLPPFLTREARQRIFSKRINEIMIHSWFPAMHHMCGLAGMSQSDADSLAERVYRYVTSGPFISS